MSKTKKPKKRSAYFGKFIAFNTETLHELLKEILNERMTTLSDESLALMLAKIGYFNVPEGEGRKILDTTIGDYVDLVVDLLKEVCTRRRKRYFVLDLTKQSARQTVKRLAIQYLQEAENYTETEAKEVVKRIDKPMTGKRVQVQLEKLYNGVVIEEFEHIKDGGWVYDLLLDDGSERKSVTEDWVTLIEDTSEV